MLSSSCRDCLLQDRNTFPVANSAIIVAESDESLASISIVKLIM